MSDYLVNRVLQSVIRASESSCIRFEPRGDVGDQDNEVKEPREIHDGIEQRPSRLLIQDELVSEVRTRDIVLMTTKAVSVDDFERDGSVGTSDMHWATSVGVFDEL